MGIVDELKKMFNMSESRRRSHVGMDVAFWDAGGLGTIGTFPPQKKEEKKIGNLPDTIIGDTKLSRNQLFEMLRRSKILLSMRVADPEVVKRLERRKKWNIDRLPIISTNLDLFPAVKYSYSSRRPKLVSSFPKVGKFVLMVLFVLAICDSTLLMLLESLMRSAKIFGEQFNGVTTTILFPSCLRLPFSMTGLGNRLISLFPFSVILIMIFLTIKLA